MIGIWGVDPICKSYNCFPFSWIQLATEICNPEPKQPSHHEISGRFPKPRKEERRATHTSSHTWCQLCHVLRCWKTWSSLTPATKTTPNLKFWEYSLQIVKHLNQDWFTKSCQINRWHSDTVCSPFVKKNTVVIFHRFFQLPGSLEPSLEPTMDEMPWMETQIRRCHDLNFPGSEQKWWPVS